MKSVQYFSPEYLEECLEMTVDDRLRFLENFRLLQDRRPAPKSRLISLRIDETLLERLRERAKSMGLPYQTLIKNLIRDHLTQESP